MTKKKNANWQKYQEETAQFFRSLGFVAQTDAPVSGARHGNNIDVLVKGQIRGIEFTWIVECKLWKNRVPKSTVQSFKDTVSNIGADKGFLVSNNGFQKGCYEVVEFTNIQLTSLIELKDATFIHIKNKDIEFYRSESSKILLKLEQNHKITDSYNSKYAQLMPEMIYVPKYIAEDESNQYPIKTIRGQIANNWNDLKLIIEASLNSAAQLAAS